LPREGGNIGRVRGWVRRRDKEGEETRNYPLPFKVCSCSDCYTASYRLFLARDLTCPQVEASTAVVPCSIGAKK